MQKIKVFIFLISIMILASISGISAQSIEVVDSLLDAKTAEYGPAAYMVVVGSGMADENITISEAVGILSEKEWGCRQKGDKDPVTLGEMSYMTMQALGMNGGIMYRLFPSQRYAVRELAYLGVIDGKAYPDKLIKGEDVIKILSKAMAIKEGE